ncbi:MAG: trypsin-like peptidase domain-containing protein [Oscillospiraceae bacterium]|nr:trypsin-like peptidase domain-containing protein [Oscillospiraceae bacterium]
MTPKKRRKLPLVILTVAAIAVSLGAGLATGNAVENSTGGNPLAEMLGIQEVKPNHREPMENIVTLNPLPENNDGGYETTAIYEKVNPSVVSINVYDNYSISAIGQGTGIVMTEDGYVITNAHVVEKGTSVNVVFHDGTSSRGTIIGMDTTTDLAVIKLDKTGLVAAEFGDSTLLKVGERVVAIGNAGGLSSTCSQGIISGLDRDLGNGARSLKLIQVDAAINPGNSGGPLINRFGQVIGINSAKIADVDYEGIGFSIPISEAIPIVEDIINHGYVKGRAVLGVSVVELNSSNGPINGLPSKGVCIMEITTDSDLTNKGVRTRDVIIEANGKEITTTDELLTELDKYSPGDLFRLKIFRAETGDVFEVDVVLIESAG